MEKITNCQISLFRKGDNLPENLASTYDDNFAWQLFANQATHYAANITTEVILLKINQHLLACTISNNEFQDSYISSPYSFYINCGLEETKKIIPSLWHLPLKGIFKLLGQMAKVTDFNKAIQINNQFTGSIIHPDWLNDHIEEIVIFLKEKFPGYAIIVPRFSPHLNNTLMQKLTELHFKFIPISPIYLYDSQTKEYNHKADTKRDRKFFAKTRYQIQEDALSTQDLAKIHHLYHLLYIKKHSAYNPQFQNNFWQDAYKHRWLNFICLFDQARVMEAFLAFQKIDQICLVSPVGINTELANGQGLNRLIYATSLQFIEKNNLILHVGRSNHSFKRTRGGKMFPEGNMVFYKYLPKRQQFIWSLLNKLLNKFSNKINSFNL